jgi:hypothetical protein
MNAIHRLLVCAKIASVFTQQQINFIFLILFPPFAAIDSTLSLLRLYVHTFKRTQKTGKLIRYSVSFERFSAHKWYNVMFKAGFEKPTDRKML